MKTIILIAILFACALAFSEVEYQSAFTFWMQQNQKSFSHDDFTYRYKVFRQNMDFIQKHNDANKGFKVAMNQFGDLTNAEFKSYFLGTPYKFTGSFKTSTKQVRAPASYDWRAQGAVTPIKNQGQCGSCWSFSTTGSTEGCHFITTKNLVSLSEQNLIDCSVAQGNQGCNGGLMTAAMQYIISNNGIDTEASYPYTTSGPNTCTFSASNIGATLNGMVNVTAGDENDLLLKATSGPVSVAIDASQNSFQFYSSGVYYEPACSTSQLDHGVLVVGWGTDTGTPFWLVKNSWGTSWGLSGYIEMSRNKQNNCGIATMATLPTC